MSERIVLRTGEALVEGSEDYLCAEPEVVIGELDGPVGQALANLIGDQVKGHTRVFALLNSDVQVRPATVMVSKVTVKGGSNLTVRAGNNLTLKGDSNVTVDGGGSTTVQGGGMLSLTGSAVGINGGGSCLPAIRLGDVFKTNDAYTGQLFVFDVGPGSSTVCIG